MASQITHIVYGKKALELFLSDQKIDEKKFFIGTVFPDIRYLGSIEREKSHYDNPTVDGLRSIEGDFQKGMYAHALVDIEREKLLNKLGMYDAVPSSGYTVSALKFIEDEFTYSLISDWDKYKQYLSDVIDEEYVLVPRENAQRWHSILSLYFSQPPTWQTILKVASELKGFSDDVLNRLKVETDKVKENTRAMEIISVTYEKLFVDEA